MIVLDTCVLIDSLRGLEESRSALRAALLTGDRLGASTITRFEVLAGMRPNEEAATHRLLAELEWIDVTSTIADRAGLLANRYRGAYSGVDPVDYVIAATADLLDAQLWTRNLKHFPMFPDLRAPY